jgi:hypothetical protein
MSKWHEYTSGLPEDELNRLWMIIKEKWPDTYIRLTNPNYSDPNYDEDIQSLDGAIHSVIWTEHPVSPEYPRHYQIYHDMKVFLGFYLTRNSLKGPYSPAG